MARLEIKSLQLKLYLVPYSRTSATINKKLRKVV